MINGSHISIESVFIVGDKGSQFNKHYFVPFHAENDEHRYLNMTRIYNKGKYRCGEWGKHLRPYQKSRGNRRWRRTFSTMSLAGMKDEGISSAPPARLRKSSPGILVRITTMRQTFKSTSTSRYRNERAFQDAIRRNGVIHYQVLKS